MLDMLIKSMGIDVEEVKKEGIKRLNEAQEKLNNIDANIQSISDNQILILANQQMIMEHLGIANEPLVVDDLREFLLKSA